MMLLRVITMLLLYYYDLNIMFVLNSMLSSKRTNQRIKPRIILSFSTRDFSQAVNFPIGR